MGWWSTHMAQPILSVTSKQNRAISEVETGDDMGMDEVLLDFDTRPYQN